MKKKNGLHIKIACEGAALVELDDLIPFQGELKSLSKENYQRLRQEIIDTGVGFPFRVWRDAGKFFLIGGHQTKLVLTQMRDEEGFSLGRVPVSFTEARDYEEAKRRVLQDITQYGKVERQGLYQFLNESKISFDELQKRFDVPGIDIKKFQIEYYELKNLASPGCDEDEVPNVKAEPKTTRGDIYQLGTHRLMCGDSTSIDDVGRLMNGEKADMVFTDPPYRMDAEGGNSQFVGKAARRLGDSIKHLCDFDPEGLFNTLPFAFDANKMNSYIFCNKDLVPDYLMWAINSGYSFNILFWKKPNALPLGGSHRPDVEYLLLFRRSAIWNNGIEGVNYSKCLEFNRELSKDHPTLKPVDLICNEIQISSNKNSPVLDLFGGSGSTLIACEKTDRLCFMMEIDPHYCDVIIARWEKYTGKKACFSNENKI